MATNISITSHYAQRGWGSDHVRQTPLQGWIMAIVMALLSGFAGVYTEAIIKKRPSRNINVQNFWLYIFGIAFDAVAILIQDFDAVMNNTLRSGLTNGQTLDLKFKKTNSALQLPVGTAISRTTVRTNKNL
ncbi:hypothetical protein CRYUN_Cryun18bG0074200 [Craigia yunnanensis]